MTARTRRPRPPLDEPNLMEMALRYVGRFATTKANLRQYLTRKARERGWKDGGSPPIEAIVERCAQSGFVDDAAFAVAKARSLTARGYGVGRVRQSLRAAGVDDGDAAEARAVASVAAVDSALQFARRRRIGPYAAAGADRDARERAIAAMVRAGHSFTVARAVVELHPGQEVDSEALLEELGLTPN